MPSADSQAPLSTAFDLTAPGGDDDDTPPTGDDIVDAARNYTGSLGYKLFSYSNQTPSGQPKDNHFVADTLDDADLGFGDDPSDRPSIADWTDPSSDIPGFAPVTDGSIQAGDVLASAKPIPKNWYTGKGQYLGIATGNDTSLGIVDNDRIGENQFGFLPGHDPLVWRSTQLADASAPAGMVDGNALDAIDPDQDGIGGLTDETGNNDQPSPDTSQPSPASGSPPNDIALGEPDCSEILNMCRARCSDEIVGNVPTLESFPRLRLCIRECMELNGCNYY